MFLRRLTAVVVAIATVPLVTTGLATATTPEIVPIVSTATTASPFQCDATVTAGTKDSINMVSGDTYTINLSGSGCTYLRGPALISSIVEVRDNNGRVLDGSTSLAGLTAITVEALYATPTSSYLRFSSNVTSDTNDSDNAVFAFRTLSGGADIGTVTLSDDGRIGSGTLAYNGDYSTKTSSYDHTATTIDVTVSASQLSPTWGLFSDLLVDTGSGAASVLSGAPTRSTVTFPLTLTAGVNTITLTLVSEDGQTSTDHPLAITRYTTITASDHTIDNGDPAPTITYTIDPNGTTLDTTPTCTSAYDPGTTYADWTTIDTTCTGASATGHVFRYVDGTITIAGEPTGPDAPTGIANTLVGSEQQLSWTAPTTSITGAITDYLIEYQIGSWLYWYPYDDGVSTATTATVTGFGNTATRFRVRAVDADGAGVPSSSVASIDSTNRLVSFTSPGSYTVTSTSGYSRYDYVIIGGGGGGGAGSGFGGGGGGGGGVLTGEIRTQSSSSPATATVVIGAGGTGGGAGSAPTAGGDTTLTGTTYNSSTATPVSRIANGGGAGGNNAATSDGSCTLNEPTNRNSGNNWGGGGGGSTSCTTGDPGSSTLGSPYGSAAPDDRAGGGGFSGASTLYAGEDASIGAAGNGGNGQISGHDGTTSYLGGGGGGGTATANGLAGTGGTGGGGNGGAGTNGEDGSDGIGGGGGGGGGFTSTGGDGGNGGAYFTWTPRVTKMNFGLANGVDYFYGTNVAVDDTTPEFVIFAEASYTNHPAVVTLVFNDGERVESRVATCNDNGDSDPSSQKCTFTTPLPAGTWEAVAEVAVAGAGGTTVTRMGGREQNGSFVFTIPDPATAVSITTTSVDDGAKDVAYSATIATTGGESPLAFSISSGALPTGLTLDTATGRISGIPTAAGGPTAFDITVTDNIGITDTVSLSMTIGRTTQDGFTIFTTQSSGLPDDTIPIVPIWALSSTGVTYSPGASTACTVDNFGVITMTHINGDNSGVCSVTATSASDANYQVATATLSIDPRSRLTVTAPSPAVTVGDPTPTMTGTPSIADVTRTGETCTTTYTSSSPAGAYPVTCSGGTATGYDITYVAGVLTATAATTTTTTTSTTTTTTTAPSTTPTDTTTTAPESETATSTTAAPTTTPDTTPTTVVTQTIITVPDNEPEPSTDPRWPTEPGKGKVIIDDEEVEVEIIIVDPDIGRIPPEQRTTEQVDIIRNTGEQMLDLIRDATGADVLPISIRYTDSGAVFIGLVIDPSTGESIEIPVEDAVLLVGGGLVLMVGGLSANGDPAEIDFDGVLEFGEGGWLAIVGFGLDPVADGEVVVMSTPRLIGRFTTTADGATATQTRIPADLPIGAHTVTVSAGSDTASLGFAVVGPTVLPTTGGHSQIWMPWIVLISALGGIVSLLRRRPLSSA